MTTIKCVTISTIMIDTTEVLMERDAVVVSMVHENANIDIFYRTENPDRDMESIKFTTEVGLGQTTFIQRPGYFMSCGYIHIFKS